MRKITLAVLATAFLAVPAMALTTTNGTDLNLGGSAEKLMPAGSNEQHMARKGRGRHHHEHCKKRSNKRCRHHHHHGSYHT